MDIEETIKQGLIDIQMHLSPSLTKAMSSSELRTHTILFEFKLLQTYGAQIGTYLLPQLDDINVWHGILFIRSGLYKNAKFKFTMQFPPEFPLYPPTLHFKQRIYHPLIDFNTGLLDFKYLFREWKYGSKHLVYSLLNELKNIFLDFTYFSIADSYNPTVAKIFAKNAEEFYKQVLGCVSHSVNVIFENLDPKSSLRFSEYNTVHEKINKELSSICSDQKLSFEQKKKEFMRQLMNGDLEGERAGTSTSLTKQSV